MKKNVQQTKTDAASLQFSVFVLIVIVRLPLDVNSRKTEFLIRTRTEKIVSVHATPTGTRFEKKKNSVTNLITKKRKTRR